MDSHAEEVVLYLLPVFTVLFFDFPLPAIVTTVEIWHFSCISQIFSLRLTTAVSLYSVFQPSLYTKQLIDILIEDCLFQAMRFIVDIDSVVQQYL